MSKPLTSGGAGARLFTRDLVGQLTDRLNEPRRHIRVVAGPRQVGKTTLVLHALAPWGDRAQYASADEPSVKDRAWIRAQWEAARLRARDAGRRGAVLALDEIQKIPDCWPGFRSIRDRPSAVVGRFQSCTCSTRR